MGMTKAQNAAKGKPRKARNSARKARRGKYYAVTFKPRKIRHVLRHSGQQAAYVWATRFDALPEYIKVMRAKGLDPNDVKRVSA